MTQRWKIIVAYDGQPFQGWQSQPSGETIQDHLQGAIARITKTNGIVVHGAGRTDAGVHALAQVAHFDAPVDLKLDSESWVRALNAHLPAQIRVLESENVPDSFHSRFSAIGKSYTYKLCIDKILPPMEFGRVWLIHQSLEEDVLKRAASLLEGKHDFRCFAANRGAKVPPPSSTVRTINEIEIAKVSNNQWTLTFTGDGFLYKMVRMLVGTMVKFALGEISENHLNALVEAQTPLKTSACAPPDGLYLAQVYYHHVASPLPPTV